MLVMVLFVIQDGKANTCTCWWWYCLWFRMARPTPVHVDDGTACDSGWQGHLYMLVMVLSVIQDGKASTCTCWSWYCLWFRMARPTPVHVGDGTVCDAGWQGKHLYMLVMPTPYSLWFRMARPTPVHVDGTACDSGWQSQLLYMLVLFVIQDGKANSCTCW